ncbi:DNA polymerase III PolC-type [Vibrio aerogenes CECT 7868]|uniref:DNA polymerase III PolC-type n=1 Tax=Vibrio aerogenes CECT 7868 TaxID=1216006 RepID=A0A1M5VD76_9VIBR|nr:exonuclease domain-containing protein [Vibrio aerogenes]SHH73156.1 DNA polymerase III PolC-type [Vibrio aerogenes CECT 7868]
MIKKLLRTLNPLHKLEKQRRAFIKRGDVPLSVRRYFETPLPNSNTPLSELNFVVLDFETTGLDPAEDTILSCGMIEINNHVLSLSTASHCYLLTHQGVKPETAVINHILPENLTGGLDQAQFTEKLLITLRNKVVVVHGATIEKRFLETLLGLPEGVHLPVIWIDTLVLESSLYVNKHNFNVDYRLFKIRERKLLPPYLAHNALADVVATGELLLVLMQEIFPQGDATLNQLYTRSTPGG